jgi:phage portal protein BeeE
MTPSRFMLMIVASICLRGNAFVEEVIANRLVSLVPLLPQNMVVNDSIAGRWSTNTRKTANGSFQ